MSSFNWTCPYCNRDQAVTTSQFHNGSFYIQNTESIYGEIGLDIVSICCANEQCKQLQLTCALKKAHHNQAMNQFLLSDVFQDWNLLPDSIAKPQPDYIPPQIVEDYTEACRIRDLSPKASATLSRRCLQGMIRDFCEIHDTSLFKEIASLREKVIVGQGVKHVHSEAVEAIDHVRLIGNIGAHMEHDVNLLIDVEPGEAQLLIELIELLFAEWYVQRETRQQKLNALKDVAHKKKQERKGMSG